MIRSTEQAAIARYEEMGSGRDYPRNTANDGGERAWPAPDMAVLNGGRREPVPMPADLFGPAWPLLCDIAEGTSTAPDYAAMGFLTACASLIGGKRMVRPYSGSTWREYPILWCGLVGDPSAGKSPALSAVTDPLRAIEGDHAEQHSDNLREYRAGCEWSKAVSADWQEAIRKAVKDGAPKPDMPADAEAPSEPSRRRLMVMDATPEAVGSILEGNPQGTMLLRDELAGWLQSFERYNSGGREFWIEAYGGRSFVIDRKGAAQPIRIPFCGVSVIGGIQPDKMSGALLGSPDDGLVGRFLWAWPDKLKRYSRPKRLADLGALESLYRNLDGLSWRTAPDGSNAGVELPLSSEASDAFEDWQVENRQVDEDASGLFKSFTGKMDGLVLRLALVGDLVRWAWRGGVEPERVSLEALIAAIMFVEDYAKPMALRTYGDAALPQVERNAALLARYIRKEGFSKINTRTLKQSPHKSCLPGLRDARVMQEAVDFLCDADWLVPAPTREGDTPGRQRQDYIVNPTVLEA